MMADEAATNEEPGIASAHPLYTVDLDQRITSWNAAASEELRDGHEVVGRRCYEVLASVDPRNASLCRPNCPVITRARAGRASQDFHVWTQDADGTSARVQVSILLQQASDPADARVVHLVRRVEEPAPAARPAGRGGVSPFRPVKRHEDAEAAELRNSITPRQVAALRLLAEGYSPEEIAASLGIRPVTIRNHIQAAMDRLGARSRLEAVIIASRAGLLESA
ncbi:MAG: LuxR C-terminal-related transcriptional regulator [Dehalococcoidia bacterium]